MVCCHANRLLHVQEFTNEQLASAEPAPSLHGQHFDYFRSLGAHDPLSAEALHSVLGPNPRGPSPPPDLPDNLSTWFSPSQRELLEQLGQHPKLSPFDQPLLPSSVPTPVGEANTQPPVKHGLGPAPADK